MENKKIIGYKLRDKAYEEAAVVLVQQNRGASKSDEKTFRNMDRPIPGISLRAEEICFESNSLASSVLSEAGVLELWFSPVFEEESLENNKWYKDSDVNVFFVQEWRKGSIGLTAIGYGFYNNGCWADAGTRVIFYDKSPLLATDEEVESAIKSEAEKRYKVGEKIESVVSEGMFGYFDKAINNIYHRGTFHSSEVSGRTVCLFKDGVWASAKFSDFSHSERGVTLYKGVSLADKFIKSPEFSCVTSFQMKVNGVKHNFSKADVELIKEYVKTLG